jgi:hypothetical protein
MSKKILERDVAKYLSSKLRKLGIEHRRVTWIGRSHAPDFFVMINGGEWVETKRPGEKPRAGQLAEHEKMRAAGCRVFVLSTFEEVEKYIADLQAARLPKKNN